MAEPADLLTRLGVFGVGAFLEAADEHHHPQAISLGLAEGAFEEAVRYARNRTAFNRPIGHFQGMRWKLAEMYRDIEVGRAMLYRACATANPFPDPYMAAVAKMYCNEMAIRVTSEAIQVHGGFGFTDDAAVSRLCLSSARDFTRISPAARMST